MTRNERQKIYRVKNWERVRLIENASRSRNIKKILKRQKEMRAANRERLKNYYADYFRKNPTKKAEIQRRYYKKNRAKILAIGRATYHNTIEYQRERSRKYHKLNPERAKIYHAEHRLKMSPEQKSAANAKRSEWKKIQSLSNPTYKIINNSRSKIHLALKRKGFRKTDNTLQLLGCTPDFFKGFLEHQFQPGMTWDNYGTVWNIDHVIPVSKFNLVELDSRLRAFNYSNCRPMWSPLNFSKCDKMPGPHQPFLI